MPKEIELVGEKKIVFGSSKEDSKIVLREGAKIMNRHFEIAFEKGTFVMRNFILSEESYGVYSRLFSKEDYTLRPGDFFRIGTLEFMVERFNTGIVSDIGGRNTMEDSF